MVEASCERLLWQRVKLGISLVSMFATIWSDNDTLEARMKNHSADQKPLDFRDAKAKRLALAQAYVH